MDFLPETNTNEVDRVLANQMSFFASNRTKDLSYRIESLKRMKEWILLNEDRILEALQRDLHKSTREALFTEILAILNELDYFIRNVKKLSKKKRVRTPIFLWPSSSTLYHEPLGQVLVISPWNFPFMLSLIPLVGAVAAGNCVVLKPSEFSVHSSQLMERLVAECFEEDHVKVIQGGVRTTQYLLSHKWGHVFFTGSCSVGKIVAAKSGNLLTPVTLELGGKSPVVVTKSSSLKIAARRIIFGKIMNAGQTCVAPDYVLVEKSCKDELVSLMILEIKKQLGELTPEHEDYGKIINLKHFDRLVELLNQAKLLHGGRHDRERRFMEISLVDAPEPGSQLENQEIFGPILPVISYENLNEAMLHIGKDKKPLAAYMFSENQEEIDLFLRDVSFGGGCINDTIIHPSNSNLKFGGIGNSGIGSYHGHQSFVTFSHKKPIVRSSSGIDLSVRYLPASSWKTKIVRFLMRF